MVLKSLSLSMLNQPTTTNPTSKNQENEKRALLEGLGTGNSEGTTLRFKLRAKVFFCEKQITEITEKLSLEEQKYQSYLVEYSDWEKQLNQIVGRPDMPDSLEYYKAQLDYIDNQLETDLSEKRSIRVELSLGILEKKREVKAFYDQIKGTIDERLAEFAEQSLHIESSLTVDSDFGDSFMDFVDKSRQGSFRGVVEGEKRLEALVQQVDWNEADLVRDFLDLIVHNLEYDCRDDTKKEPVFIGNQVPKRKQFYDFLFSLDYLHPIYELKQGEKSLEELSPGEKGALLLIFYLILDKSDIPLLIDQPEDNLDNKSVATVLVPYIKAAKRRRQIIMITHNPNLAVVADAEQVIKVEIDKEDANRFSFVSGSIENNEINRAIVEVLEGTMPAFTTRRNKYRE